MSRTSTARLFAALTPPREVQQQLAAWAAEAGAALEQGGLGRAAVRRLGQESLHITLCFLGARPVAEIDRIAAAVTSLPQDALELSLGAPLLLPTRAPRALAVQVLDGGGQLERLQRLCCEAIAAASGWSAPRGRYLAHLTVARGSSLQFAGGPLPPTPVVEFTAEAIVLQRSWLEPQGARYEAIATRYLERY